MESDKKRTKEKPAHPRATANPLSAITFSWTLPVFLRGRQRELEVEDLFAPLDEHKSSYLGDKFESAWSIEVERCKKKKKEPSFTRVIFKVFGCQILALGILIFVSEIIIRVAQPLLLGGLIDYFTSGDDGNEDKLFEAYMYALGVVLCSAVSVFLAHPYMMGIMHIGMKIRVASCSLIYRKALKLSKTALGQTTVGQLVNLLSNDVNRFDIAFIFLHNLWIGPLQTFIVTYFVWELIGPASIVGLLSLLLFIPLQAWLGKKVSMLRLKTAIRTDERVRLMNEIISGIQVIKMYTWEKPFALLVSQARRKEINVITQSSYCRGIMLSFIMFHTRTSIFLSILAYILFGNNDISAQKVFVVTCFYNTLRQTMTVFFPQGIAMVAECLISIKRIKAFLLYDETTNPSALNVVKYKESDVRDASKSQDEKNDSLNTSNGIIPNEVASDEKCEQGLFLENVTAKWIGEQSENTLTNIDLCVVPGKLTAIIGPVGAGKSSLLHVLLKELPLLQGSLRVNGTVSYASQEPWLFVGSVRQNILFGLPYDKDRYRQVVRVCALTTDFEQLPHGDKTLIGERGISLSGGQRARVNLARAVYKKADIYLLDDPLSAVDTHVGKHLFEDCIAGYLKEKTVILITHQLQYLNNVDHIVLLENGVISAEGSFNDLQSKGLDFTKLLISTHDEEAPSKISYSRQSSVQSVASSVDEMHRSEPVEEAESRTKGTVKSGVYTAYLRAGGGCCTLFFMLILFIVAQGFASGGDYWTAYWVNVEEGTNFTHEERAMYIYIFAGLTVGTIVVTLIRSFLFFYMCMKASMWLHNSMFDSITRATMRFFNTNTSGRILNRFSKDMGSIDELLPSSLADVLQIGLALLAIIIVVAITNPWLLIPTGVCAVIFYFLRIFYLSTSRSVKRLEGITRSPVFAHLNASLQGLTTIRAFNAQKILQTEFDNHQDLHSSAWYLFIASSRAFGFWLDSVCLVYIGLVTFSFLVLMPDSFGGAVGLAITQSIGLVGMFQWGMRQTAELENQMTSVERVLEYAELESEPPLEATPDKKPKESWPEHGKIEFEHVSLRYSPNDPWVLKNLNFTIAPQQKIGIVGRTGAGKSSLISALFRLSETEGEIRLDGIESKSVGLHDLRAKISIIPQEPVLFSGSLRKNLDPFDQFPDEVLWSALEQVELKEPVSELAGGLSAKMAEGGANFSVGQRQLVCLARAIVRNNKVLVLDEATANVDPKTDSLIQKTIRTKFAGCTVLTIAHRLNTVMDSDKVLVMDAGALVEFDHPHLLLQNEYGFLSKMVEQTGKATAEALKEVASKCYQEYLKNSEEEPQ